jgi:MFS superfamily sulfate permease-like transporter
MSALGPIVAGPIYVWVLGDQFPALYPTIDAFVAPFLVQQATIVDQMLYENGLEDDENLFMTTFCVLSGLGLIFTGLFLFIGTKFKLANLGAYLPYPVMAGFFSTVGFLGWTLAFSVDTGKNIGEVIRDADWNETKHCLIHHIPSVVLGLSISIFISGPRKSWTPLFVLGTIPVVFTIMLFTGTTLDEARQDGWFWKKEEFESVSDSSIYDYNSGDGFSWNPPLPFGVFVGVLRGNVYLPAIIKGLPVSLAMGLMYLLRCSLHVPALQKNSETLLKWAEDQELQIRAMKSKEAIKSPTLENYENVEDRLRTFSEESCYNQDADEIENNQVSKVEKKAHSVSDIYVWYGKCLCISGLAGGSATIPSMGASITLFKMGARGKAPQYGSIILLVFFYTNKFELVGYFPRIVFSTLLFVSSTDLLNNWFVLSYQKTADRGEWLIVPILSLFAFVVGVLPAVAFGMALSTILFVGTFYKSGVVKFISTGKTVHSTTERNVDDAEWLDFNGDLIQVMVIQNYLFFGNANTLKSFVSKMFHKAENSASFPKYLIMDLSLVTGMDTSAVEIFSDIVTLCYGNKCQVFLAGLSQRLTYTMRRGGVIPSSDKMSKFSILRLPPTMESALMKAEDGLLKFEFKTEEREMRHFLERNKSDKDGFLHTLELINQKQRISIALNLKGLLPYTKRLSLAAGESLLHNLDGSDNARERGLFFIEQGIMRVERDAHANLTRTGNTFNSITSFNDSMRNDSSVSLTKLKDAWVKELSLEDKRNVRIARIGSGW